MRMRAHPHIHTLRERPTLTNNCASRSCVLLAATRACRLGVKNMLNYTRDHSVDDSLKYGLVSDTSTLSIVLPCRKKIQITPMVPSPWHTCAQHAHARTPQSILLPVLGDCGQGLMCVQTCLSCLHGPWYDWPITGLSCVDADVERSNGPVRRYENCRPGFHDETNTGII